MYKFLAVLVVLIFLEEFAEYLYKKTSRYKNSRAGYAHIHSEIPGGLEICNVGSGPALYGIDYAYSSKQGFNFSTAPQNFKNGFRLLKRFHEKINPGAIIIIVIMCPLSFGRNSDYNSLGYFDKFYGVLPPDEIDNYSRVRAFKIAHPFLMKIFQKIRRAKNHSRTQEKIHDEPGLISTWKSEFDLKNLLDPSQAEAHRKTFTEKISILSEEIEYCRAKNWRPVFVLPPVPESTRKYISDDFVKAFMYDNLKILTEKFPDVKIFDYFYDKRITQDMFKDDIFLNAKGRENFSKILFSEIEKEL